MRWKWIFPKLKCKIGEFAERGIEIVDWRELVREIGHVNRSKLEGNRWSRRIEGRK